MLDPIAVWKTSLLVEPAVSSLLIHDGARSYGEQDRGQVLGDVGGLLKLVCDARSQRVVGVHVVGEGAEEIAHLGQACMHFAGTLEYFVRAVFNLPTLSA